MNKPIIDVHTHIFNGADIPLEGYLERKIDYKEYKPFHGLLEMLIPGMTENIRDNIAPGKKPGFWEKLKNSFIFEVAMGILGKNMRNWATTLKHEKQDIIRELIDTYKEPKISLFIPLMVDYEYWFENTTDEKIDEQYRKIAANVIKYQGQIHPFAAYCPARQLACEKKYFTPDKIEDQRVIETINSLKLVKKYVGSDEYSSQGFLGVKLYNAIGYKPIGNNLAEDSRKKIPMHGEPTHTEFGQINAELKYRDFKGDDYDKVLNDLYAYCQENDVPITAHCLMDGFESYEGGSYDYGKPEYWKDVLKQYPELRINLAHFCLCRWEGITDPKVFPGVNTICDMILKYDNLYTDVALHRVFLNKRENDNDIIREDIKNIFIKIKNDYGDDDFNKIKKKLLFGTDWHVSERVDNFRNSVTEYKTLLQKIGFSVTEIDDFFCNNALDFLGLRDGMKNRNRLKEFYERYAIPEPEWFKITTEEVAIG